jgi:uncharacterized membrane protein (GlpM family)
MDNFLEQYDSFPQLYATKSLIHLHYNCHKSKGIHHLINALIFGLFIFPSHIYNMISCCYFVHSC